MKTSFLVLLISILCFSTGFAKNQWSSDIVVEAGKTDYIEFRDRLVPNDWHSQETTRPQEGSENMGTLPKGYYYPQTVNVEYVERTYPAWKKFTPTPDLPNPIHNHGMLVHGYNLRHDVHAYDHSQVQILEDGSRISLKDTVPNPTLN